jgi:N-acetylglucosaminyl-diphospho-decaprenol L-rhamnosyltransferase
MFLNKSLTIVFNCFYSRKHLFRVLKNLNKYPIIVVENSLDINLKKELEKKYKNVKVIIPKENLGAAKGYNLAIKHAKTKYVFLNAPDIEISNKTIDELILCALKIKEFGAISPTYNNEKIYKNYSDLNKKFYSNSKFLNLKKIIQVNWIDNNFLINKNKIKKKLFDENYFLYFETMDFCLNQKRKEKKLFVFKKIKFRHYGAKSTDDKYKDIVHLTRAWHYNWSKFYYFKKNFSYMYALRKITPNFVQAIKKIIVNAAKFDKFNVLLSVIEIYGILSSILCLKSFYRPSVKPKRN